MSATAGLGDYFRLEARSAPRRAPIALAFAGLAAVAFSHWVIPLLPPRVISFMELGFRIDGMAAVLLFNDIVAVYFAAFFVGASGLLAAIVSAREEHRLEILLAKPVAPAIFLAARTVPVLIASATVGVLVSIGCAVALVPRIDAHATVTLAGALGAGLFLTAVTLVQLAALTIAFVRMRDAFYGLLVAAGVWIAPMMSTAVLLYRPDLYEGRDGLADAITLPSLLWHDGTTAWAGPIALLLAVPLAGVLLALAGRRLSRGDAV